jgi:hypothetical protein
MRFAPTGSRFVYYQMDGELFFSIGWPVHQTVVLNRAKYDPELHLPVRARKPKGTQT